jgi:hypothetical protein
MVNTISEEQAYQYARQYLPEKVPTESKENGDNSGILQVYKHDNKWFIRYLDAHLVFDYSVLGAVEKMRAWMDSVGLIYPSR